MVEKVLVANRGVAAVRIVRTLGRLGIPYVVVHSDADRDLPFVTEAAEAYCIGGNRPAESYLRGDAIIAAMHATNADAVHPGYGFLSESAEFARNVAAAGLTFIGPDVDHIATLGDKAASRTWMKEQGIPVSPASEPLPEGQPYEATAAAIGYPLLIKASGGGGGVGMQRVANEAELEPAIQRARGIAQRFFADSRVYMERLLEEARHVEFQIVGDGRGHAVCLGHRDCSVQRRHQKVIEEAPIPLVDEAAAAALGQRLAEVFGRYGYLSLATVEMLMDRAGNFHFLEVNTRLQVEHGVTEAICGLDLVELQLRLADGQPLDVAAPLQGHAIEARIYAEDPVKFLPSPGPLTTFRAPSPSADIRIDLGYAEGNVVTPYYDPMLALVVAKGSERADAVARLDATLAGFAVEGVKTNIQFLRRILASTEFETGMHHTTFAEAFAKRT